MRERDEIYPTATPASHACLYRERERKRERERSFVKEVYKVENPQEQLRIQGYLKNHGTLESLILCFLAFHRKGGGHYRLYPNKE